MISILRYVAGPELIWLLACLGAGYFKRANILREGYYNKFIENYAIWIPIFILTLSMMLFSFPAIPRKYLLLRICIAALIGTHFFLDTFLKAHTEGGPGVGTIYIVGIGLILVAILVAVILKFIFIKS